MSMLKRLVPLFAIVLVIAAACGWGGPSDKDVVISLTDNVLVPAYSAASEDAAVLHGNVEAMCDSPSHFSLLTAQESWLEARATWTFTTSMWFGPFMERRSRRVVDWTPTETAAIDRLLAENSSISLLQVREVIASTQRGFGAIEYVLFEENVVADLESSPVHCEYLTAMTRVLSEETQAIYSDWTTGSGGAPYKDYFTERSEISLTPDSAVAEFVRHQVFLIRNMVDMRLASILGLRGAPDFSTLPGTTADNGLQDLRHELLGMQAVYLGSGEGGLGISSLVSHLSQETDSRLKDQFTAALEAIDSVEGTLRVAVAQRPDVVRNVYDHLSELQQTISVDVVSLLGVSVGFTDTDGDSLR